MLNIYGITRVCLEKQQKLPDKTARKLYFKPKSAIYQGKNLLIISTTNKHFADNLYRLFYMLQLTEFI